MLSTYFPTNEERRAHWMEILGLTAVSKSTVVCSKHFDNDSFVENNQCSKVRQLRPTAIPRYAAFDRKPFFSIKL